MGFQPSTVVVGVRINGDFFHLKIYASKELGDLLKSFETWDRAIFT